MKQLNINKKVWILSSKKSDGRYNQGKVVGIENTNDNLYFVNKTHFYKGFLPRRYKVAYIDLVTKRGFSEWFSYNDVVITAPSR
jgi:hypothetical protein